MSHYSVLVIGSDVEGKLEPFDENIVMDKYVAFTKEQLIEKGKKEIEDYRTKGCYAEYLKNPAKYIEDHGGNGNHVKYVSEEFPKKLNWSDEEIYQDQIRWYEPENIGTEGEVYSTYNPQSKWDWYEIGGRWAGMLLGKDGCDLPAPNFSWGWKEEDKLKVMAERRIDQAKKCEIDWEAMRKEQEKRIPDLTKQYEDGIAGKGWYKAEYFQQRYPTLEDYIRENTQFSTYAVLDENGKWHEAGEMGWFGCAGGEPEDHVEFHKNFFEKFIAHLPEDTLLTIVDCHI